MRPTLRQVFGIDERSLALLRIGLGLILLVDLAIRARSITAHYTDHGVLPRAAHFELFPDPWSWSLHMLSGAAFFQAALFLIAADAAVALTVGYRTRLMTIISWVLLISLHTRNPLILNGGDLLLRMLLLWSIFLPLGARASIDRLRQREPDEVTEPTGMDRRDPQVLSVASAGILLQVVTVYVFSGIGKLNDLWQSGEAMSLILSMDLYVKPWGAALLDYPGLLRGVSRVTPWLEIVLPLAVLLPIATQRVRLLVIAAMLLFHLGIELTLHVGLFTPVAMLAWLVFLPPIFWDACARRIDASGLHAWLAARIRPAPAHRPAVSLRGRRTRRWTVNAAAACLLLYVVVWNVRVRNLPLGNDHIMPLGLTPVGRMLSIDQKWSMFTTPRQSDGWYILVGEFRDGSKIELLTGRPFDPFTVSKPPHIASLFPDHRWRKYYRVLSSPRSAPLRAYLPRVLCHQWSARNPDNPIISLEITYIEETPAPRGGRPELRQLQFYRGPCPRPDDITFPRPELNGDL